MAPEFGIFDTSNSENSNRNLFGVLEWSVMLTVMLFLFTIWELYVSI